MATGTDSVVVYAETNFLVAAVFPHREDHYPANSLLNSGIRIKIPQVAKFESRSAIRNAVRDLSNQVKQSRAILDALRETRIASLNSDTFLQLMTELETYAREDFDRRLADVIANPALEWLQSDVETFALADRLFLETNLSHGDMWDAQILASILNDAKRLPVNTPRLFMSRNKREFQEGQDKKLPSAFYVPYRMVYVDGFDIDHGMRLWERQYVSQGKG